MFGVMNPVQEEQPASRDLSRKHRFTRFVTLGGHPYPGFGGRLQSLLLLGLCLVDGRAHAQSFDCAKAATQIEHAICENKVLGELDVTLARTLQDTLSTKPDQRKALLGDERRWIAFRDRKCAPKTVNAGLPVAQCLAEIYRSRIADIKSAADGTENPSRLTLATETSASKLLPACSEAEQRLNDWLKRADEANTIFPSAVANTVSAEALPRGTGPGAGANVWSIRISDARVGDTALKAISYGEGGTCHGQTLELWDPTYQHQVKIPTSDLDEATNSPTDPADDGDYASEELALLQGRSYFAHVTRSAKYVKLYELRENLTARPACEIVRMPVGNESVEFAADAALCTAVLAGKADNGALTVTEPSDLTDDVSARVLGDLVWGQDRPLSVVARGQADPYNDAHPHLVGMISYHHSDGAGCGHDWSAQWPAILDKDGLPAGPVKQDIAFEHAGEISRLLRYRGTTYFETRTPDPMDGLPRHDVWRLTVDGATKMCSFNLARYRAQLVPVPASPDRSEQTR